MIHDNIEFHNVAELRRVPGRDGLRLQRVPEEVRLQLNPRAQQMMIEPDGCEIRFLCDEPRARVTLSSESRTPALVWFGEFEGRQRCTIGPEPTTIEMAMDPRLQDLDPSHCAAMPFSPRVFRLRIGVPHAASVYYHGIEGANIRPPAPELLPSLRYLAYGTSITHGVAATAAHLSYASQTAYHLGADLINLGSGGSAHCERVIADYMAGRDDWDIATLALSVNMHGFDLGEFRERVSYMLDAVAGSHINKPVACITLYPYFRDWGISDPGTMYGGTPEEYRQALRDAAAACPHPNLRLIEGPELLTDIRGLTHDLIHPADNGMIEMGRNLAAKLRPLLQ